MLEKKTAVEMKIIDARLCNWGFPKYHTMFAAGIDIHACIQEDILMEPSSSPILISSGFSLWMNHADLAAFILPRSGLGHRGLVLGNLVGLIDADYTGPIMVSAWNRNAPGTPPIRIAPGDRFAQLVFVPVLRPEFLVVEEFTAPSGRGAGGFGSTGHR